MRNLLRRSTYEGLFVVYLKWFMFLEIVPLGAQYTIETKWCSIYNREYALYIFDFVCKRNELEGGAGYDLRITFF